MNEENIPIIGKHTLESLTVGMYSDPFTLYREYIQNACDAIDTAVMENIIKKSDAKIEIHTSSKEKKVIISDNGIGIKSGDAFSILCDIGNSKKDHRFTRGFRGIGRLGGLGYAEKIVFKAKYFNESVESNVIWDAQRLKQLLIPGDSREKDLVKVIKEVTSIEFKEAKNDEHYFIVELYGIDDSFPELVDEMEVGNYLAMVAPVPFDCQKIIYGKTIKSQFLSEGISIEEYAIYLNNSPQPITKKYRTNYFTGKQERTSKRNDIYDIEFFMGNSILGEIAYIGWLGISDFSGTIDDDFMRGIRVRKGNILIGDESTFNQFFPSEKNRANGVFVGEVHILLKDVIPNARRDDFEPNESFSYIKEKLNEYADIINKKYRRGYSQLNSALKRYEEGEKYLDKINEDLENNGITSENQKKILREQKEKVEKQLSEAAYELEKAKNKIGEDNRRSVQVNKVLAKHEDNLKNIVALENKIVNSEYKGKNGLSFLNREERKIYKIIVEVIDEVLPKDMAHNLIEKIIIALTPGGKGK